MKIKKKNFLNGDLVFQVGFVLDRILYHCLAKILVNILIKFVDFGSNLNYKKKHFAIKFFRII